MNRHGIILFAGSFLLTAQAHAYPVPETLLERAVRGAVGCHESLGGAMPLSFDEEGICGEESVWLNASQNPNLVITETSRSIENGGSSYFMQMTADVSYVNSSEQVCAFRLDAIFTDEDASMRLTGPVICE